MPYVTRCGGIKPRISALDVNGILQVYPSLGRDQAEQLRRTFASFTRYEIEIRNPQIDVQADTASFAQRSLDG